LCLRSLGPWWHSPANGIRIARLLRASRRIEPRIAIALTAPTIEGLLRLLAIETHVSIVKRLLVSSVANSGYAISRYATSRVYAYIRVSPSSLLQLHVHKISTITIATYSV
jgi:hypothetical protein